MSKGSKQRPTDTKKYNENYDKIFRKPKRKEYKDEGPKYEGPWGKDLGLKWIWKNILWIIGVHETRVWGRVITSNKIHTY